MQSNSTSSTFYQSLLEEFFSIYSPLRELSAILFSKIHKYFQLLFIKNDLKKKKTCKNLGNEIIFIVDRIPSLFFFGVSSKIMNLKYFKKYRKGEIEEYHQADLKRKTEVKKKKSMSRSIFSLEIDQKLCNESMCPL